MTDIRTLTDACIHCGFCLPSCPTYQVTGEEAHSPRGRIHLLRQMLDGDSTPAEISGPIDSCLGCLACVPACPSGVQYEEIVEHARQAIAGSRDAVDKATRTAVFAVLPHARRLRAATAPLRAFPDLAWVSPALAAAADLAPRDVSNARALPPRVAARPNGHVGGARRGVVGLLAGCAQSVFFRHVSAATARVLALEGFDVLAPSGDRCCGALSLHAGRADEARRLARRVVSTFTRAGVDALIADVAGCGSTMKQYARLLANDPRWSGPAAALAQKVYDVSEFLDGVEPLATRNPLPLTVAYHDACHLSNGQGIRRQPRALLDAIPSLKVIELGDNGRCCGSAGTYNLFQPEMAATLGDLKADAIAGTQASVVAAGNPGCLLQIDAALGRAGSKVITRHTIELVDASLRNAGRESAPP